MAGLRWGRILVGGAVMGAVAFAGAAFGEGGSRVVNDRVLLDQARESLAGASASGGGASRSVALSGLSDREALALAKSEFGDLLAGAQWEAPVLPESSRIVGYASDSTAIVSGPSGRLLLASLLPLRSPDGGSVKAPVSTDLERVAGGFEPANALSEVSIPANVGDGVGLDRVGITVTPVGVDGADGVRVADDKVFYANARTDTDLMVAALPTGVETFAQIRSARSPNNQGLKFGLPEGATLRSGAGGVGVEVVRGGSVLARVSPAVAVDANGLNVPVSMGVSGDTVDLRVDDSAAGVEYPIMLDPTISVDSRFLDVPTSSQSFMGWEFRSSNPNAFTSSTSGAWGRGLYSLARASAMASGDVGQWSYTAPGDARLAGFGFGSATRAPNPANGFVPICTSQGIRTAGGAWEPNSAWQSGSVVGSGPRTVCQGAAVTESPSFGLLGWSPGEGSASNVAVNLQWAYGAGTRLRYSNDPFGVSEYDYIGSAYVLIADDRPPMVDVTHSSAVPDGWVRDFTGTVTVGGNDTGTGIWRLKLSGPVGPSGPDSANQEQGYWCEGGRAVPCPASWNISQQWPATRSFTYSSGRLPEGVNTLAATATDRAGNVSGRKEWTVKVDRTPPTVTLGGSLSDGTQSDPTDPAPELTITADDPTVNGSASGVASAELFVDGVTTNTQEQQDLQRIETDQCTDAECRFVGFAAPSTDGGEAPDADTVSLDTSTLTPGAHNLRLVVTDKAGNTRQVEWVYTNASGSLGLPEPAEADVFGATLSSLGSGSGIPDDAIEGSGYVQDGSINTVETRYVTAQAAANWRIFTSARCTIDEWEVLVVDGWYVGPEAVASCRLTLSRSWTKWAARHRGSMIVGVTAAAGQVCSDLVSKVPFIGGVVRTTVSAGCGAFVANLVARATGGIPQAARKGRCADLLGRVAARAGSFSYRAWSRVHYGKGCR
ncbi:MAG: hypothetical protein WCO96_07905 [Actinomycetes bacterium]